MFTNTELLTKYCDVKKSLWFAAAVESVTRPQSCAWPKSRKCACPSVRDNDDLWECRPFAVVVFIFFITFLLCLKFV